MDQKIKFELDRLPLRDEASVIAEMRRVSDLVPDGPLSTYVFDEHSRIHSSTLRRRFGNWQQALEKAGLGHRFDNCSYQRLVRTLAVVGFAKPTFDAGRFDLKEAQKGVDSYGLLMMTLS